MAAAVAAAAAEHMRPPDTYDHAEHECPHFLAEVRVDLRAELDERAQEPLELAQVRPGGTRRGRRGRGAAGIAVVRGEHHGRGGRRSAVQGGGNVAERRRRRGRGCRRSQVIDGPFLGAGRRLDACERERTVSFSFSEKVRGRRIGRVNAINREEM